MPKAHINAYDAFALLEGRKLYKEQLCDVLTCELKAKKVLCMSDTTDVLVRAHQTTPSIAHTIEKAALGPQLQVFQTDFMDFRFLSEEERNKAESPKFGLHLPQNLLETRREYLKVDATKLEEDLSVFDGVDVVLGKNCICGCEGNGKLCGGVDNSIEAQQKYLETLIELEPSLVVLSAASATFFPEDETNPVDIEAKNKAQQQYKEAKRNMKEVCKNLNAKDDSPYRFVLVEPDTNLKFIASHPKNENGYMIVAYDTRKIDFKPTTVSLQAEREKEKIEAIRSKVSTAALIEQRKKIMGDPADKENIKERENTTQISPRDKKFF